MKVLIPTTTTTQNSNEDHPMKMLFSFHSHMLDISLHLDSLKFFMTLKVWVGTISAYSYVIFYSFQINHSNSFVFKFCILGYFVPLEEKVWSIILAKQKVQSIILAAFCPNDMPWLHWKKQDRNKEPNLNCIKQCKYSGLKCKSNTHISHSR